MFERVISKISRHKMKTEYQLLKDGMRNRRIKEMLVNGYEFNPYVADILIKSGDWNKILNEVEMEEIGEI